MSATVQRPDLQAILGGLKDFQRDTVEYVFRRMYTDPDQTRRFLIADEVGLGKTLVARGLIAHALNHLWDEVERLDIVYICSNADIARQNINRLNITGQQDFSLASRITLLPITLHSLARNKVNFVSFTPGTSFNLGGTLGLGQERILLYWMLQHAWQFDTGHTGPYNLLQGSMGMQRFRDQVRAFPRRTIDRDLNEHFARELAQREAGMQLRARFDDLRERFRRTRDDIPRQDSRERARLVGDLREVLAEVCLSALEPDLIILDEFQRFKHLLEQNDSDVNQLAHQLFNYADHTSAARVILLSATPYKMYTLTYDQEQGDDHHEDFVRTLRFLQPAQADAFERLVKAYRHELFRLGQGNDAQVQAIKDELEQCLRKVMVRTERLSTSADRDGMLHEVRGRSAQLAAGDLQSYLAYQRVARVLEHADVMEYWKSSPYLLNFMDDYQLKLAFKRAQIEHSADLAGALASSESALLPWDDIQAYRKVDPGNARLRSLMADVIDTNAWRLLWVPPALPYYQLEGPFAEAQLAGFTKRLVFSSWKLVPKVVATLTSYEAERQIMSAADSDAVNTAEAREKRKGLLVFAKSDDCLSGMAVLGTLYPSLTLAHDCDPLAATIDLRQHGTPSLDTVLEIVRKKIDTKLQPILRSAKPTLLEDQAWYWAAPILLDLYYHPKASREWLKQENLAQIWSGAIENVEDGAEDRTQWSAHVEEARKLLGPPKLGRPPADLADVLALLAIGGPAVLALRALWRSADRPGLPLPARTKNVPMRNHAAQVAWHFRSLYNIPEAVALIRSLPLRDIGTDYAYWRRVLVYNAIGCLQAVLDEFAHVLRESLGLLDAPAEILTQQIANIIGNALSLRTTALGVDRVDVSPEGDRVVSDSMRLRSHFALRFGEEKRDDGKGENRKEQVRAAFNSPFWPFVLATTSVGQEGLDFHTYCHAIVHWNLPANPVDLEQREGRIHRYKGHAVRKNLAEHYGLASVHTHDADPWEALFKLAQQRRPEHELDLVPYWVFSGSSKIERHVPVLPLSRDNDRLEGLRRSLAVYRMVFGQNRQEDLLTYLLSSLSAEQLDAMARDLCINLEPPHAKQSSKRAVGATDRGQE